MSDTSARHGPSPTASLNSVKLDQHQPQPGVAVTTADPSPPAREQAAAPDATTVLMLALFAAVVVSAFWKVLLRVVVVGALTLVFAGVLVVPLMLMRR